MAQAINKVYEKKKKDLFGNPRKNTALSWNIQVSDDSFSVNVKDWITHCPLSTLEKGRQGNSNYQTVML